MFKCEIRTSLCLVEFGLLPVEEGDEDAVLP